MKVPPRRVVKAALLLFASGLSGLVTAGLLRAVGAHAIGTVPVDLALVVGAALAATAFAFGITILRKLRDLSMAVQESSRQLAALIAIRPLTGSLPLPLGGWAIDPVFAELLVQIVTRERPRLVVECGSGSSTVLTARCLGALGVGRVVSLEHDQRYAEATRALLRLHGVSEWADVRHAPLVERPVGDTTGTWYDVAPSTLPDGAIDLLIVDGPPAVTEQMSRYPAVPLLRRHLAPNCIILLDDGDREGERRISELWAGDLDATREYVQGGKGTWVLRPQAARSETPRADETPTPRVLRANAQHEARVTP